MGFLSSFISAFFTSAKDTVSKRLLRSVDGTSSTFASFAFALPYYLAALAIAWSLGFENFVFGSGFVVLVLLRSITDSGAEWCKMQALARGDISLLSSFLSISPIFLLFLSPLITDDKISFLAGLGVVVVVLGSFNLAWRPSGQASSRGIAYALASAFFFSLNHCLDRLAVQRSSALLAGFTMTFASALIFLPFMLAARRRQVISANIPGFTLRGFFEIGSMFAKLFALQYMPAPYVVGIMRVSIILSVFSGYLFFGEKEIKTRLISGTITLLGILLIVLFP